jgi:hypothetical protein
VDSENIGGRWVLSGNREEPNLQGPIPGGHIIFSVDNKKCPDTVGPMEKYAPAPVEEVETVEKRFVMPKMPALTVGPDYARRHYRSLRLHCP